MPSASQTVNKKQQTPKRHQPKGLLFNVSGYQLKPGFTFIEIVLFLLFIIALITILLSASGTYAISRKSNLQGVATKIATCEIEGLRKLSFSNLPGSGTFTDSSCSQGTPLPQPTYTRTISDYQGNLKIKLVTVTINWVENSVTREIKLETLIYENGI